MRLSGVAELETLDPQVICKFDGASSTDVKTLDNPWTHYYKVFIRSTLKEP